jgi:type I restriction enzyme, S subunit
MSEITRYELPSNWIWTTIGELFDIIMGQSPPGTSYNFEGKGVPLLNGPTEFGKDFPSVKQWTTQPTKVTEAGDLLICVRGSIGKMNWADQRYCIGRGLAAIHPLHSELNTRFLFYFLKTMTNELVRQTSGSTFSNLRSEKLRGFLFPIAPLEEQKRILNRISELLSESKVAKESIDKIKPLMKKLRQSVLFEATSGRLTANWRRDNPDVEPASEFLDKIVRVENNNSGATRVSTEELPEIPQSWQWTSLQAISEIRGGITKGKKYKGKKTIQIPYLRVANVQDGYLDLSEIKTIQALPEDVERYRLMKGDILFNEGGDRDKLGRGCIWNEEIQDCIHQNHVFRARLLSDNILPDYVTIFSKSKLARDYFFKFASQTVNLASLNMTALKNLPIAIPPKSEQEEIFDLVNKYLSLADRVEQFCQRAKDNVYRLTQSILTKAFHGELVPQNSDDEPASILLKQVNSERKRS